MREGITLGEIPIDPAVPYERTPKAANLTTDGEKRNQEGLWCEDNKTVIRLTVEIDESELKDFRWVKEKYQTPQKWLKILAPYEVRNKWFYAFGGVKPEQITLVEYWTGTDYRAVKDVPRFVDLIQKELDEKFEISQFPFGKQKGAKRVELKPQFLPEDTWIGSSLTQDF